MKQQKKVELDFSRMYGFKILKTDANSLVASETGTDKKPVQQVLGSKIGGKTGFKKV